MVLYFLFLVLVIPGAFSANVLISSLQGEGSHFTVGAAIGEGLVRRGHNVTCLIGRAYEGRASDPKYANLSFEIFDHRKTVQEIRDFWLKFNTLAFKKPDEQLVLGFHMLIEVLGEDCEGIFTNSALMKRLHSIDAIVMDIAWPCGMFMKMLLERDANKTIPTVSISPFTPQGLVLYFYGSTYNPAFQPEFMTGYSNQMTFAQRLGNLFQSVFQMFLGVTITFPPYIKTATDLGFDARVFSKFEFGYELFDLHLLSMDFSSEFPFPLAPHFISVGGLTARPARQLDEV